MTVINSIKRSSCLPHHKSVVNRFYLSLHLLLIPIFLTTYYSLSSHSIWSVASPALIPSVQILPQTPPTRKAWSPLNRIISKLPPWAPKPLTEIPYFAPGWSQYSSNSKSSFPSHHLRVPSFKKFLCWSLSFVFMFPSFSDWHNLTSIIAAISSFLFLKAFPSNSSHWNPVSSP